MSPRAAKTQAKPLRAGIYDRVSSDRRGDARSVAEQQAGNRAATDANGWDVALTAADNDVSASRFANGKARPGWESIVAAIEADQIDVLVLWEPSRGSRELVAWATLIATCRSRGVMIHVTSHHRTYDPTVPRDWRSLAEDGVDSGYESEKASERIKRSMAANAIAGRPHGRVPFGFERVYDPATKALIAQRAHPDQAPVVLEIFRRINAGEPIVAVTRTLNAAGAVSTTEGTPWARENVRRIALSPLYIAKRRAGGELLDGNWPALVDEATFWAVTRRLNDPIRKTTRPGRARWLLSYLARCGVCGATLAGIPAKRGRPASYRCGGGTVHVSIGQQVLDDHVVVNLVAKLADPGYCAEILAAADPVGLGAQGEVEALEAQLEEFRDLAGQGELTAISLARVEAGLLPRLAAAQARAAAAAVPAALIGLLDLEGGAAEVLLRFQEMPLPARREAIRAVMTVKVNRAANRGDNRGVDTSRIEIGKAQRP
ncbi:recombinase family protein [Sporichthya sp.]|uniref:recombinase family protein n=1 Tax=Sporichthya sp. TaxID=65475 RepID=UPI0017A1BF2D|nr:recombinase family protein [Sporichthya sp.]MBA3742488.1 recombinase family protein [Sporichthya sp.]